MILFEVERFNLPSSVWWYISFDISFHEYINCLYIYKNGREYIPISCNPSTKSTNKILTLQTNSKPYKFPVICTCNSIKDKKTSIDEINKTLGIQSRPYKIQNNIRAEVISKINKTYAAFNEIGDEIIIRNQATFDKRFKEYQINDRYLKKLQELTGKLNTTTK